MAVRGARGAEVRVVRVAECQGEAPVRTAAVLRQSVEELPATAKVRAEELDVGQAELLILAVAPVAVSHVGQEDEAVPNLLELVLGLGLASVDNS